jgi:hypothetical protein
VAEIRDQAVRDVDRGAGQIPDRLGEVSPRRRQSIVFAQGRDPPCIQ